MLHGMGHGIKFVKGQPTWVPRCLHREAIGIGAECLTEKVDFSEPDEVLPENLTPADKEALFFSAFDLLIARNQREDFGGDGKPSMPALKALLNFGFVKKDRDAALMAYRVKKDAELEAA